MNVKEIKIIKIVQLVNVILLILKLVVNATRNVILKTLIE